LVIETSLYYDARSEKTSKYVDSYPHSFERLEPIYIATYKASQRCKNLSSESQTREPHVSHLDNLVTGHLSD